MLKKFKRTILFSAFSLLTLCPATSFAWHGYDNDGDWDYYGSGRDHPYSAYIDRKNYIGYADYSFLGPDFVDGPAVPAQLIVQAPASPAAQPDEFTVNVPNDHGGYTTVLIKRSGNGFTGPQGEYYPQFPTVAQLKIMYGK